MALLEAAIPLAPSTAALLSAQGSGVVVLVLGTAGGLGLCVVPGLLRPGFRVCGF